jgi:alpha-amylase
MRCPSIVHHVCLYFLIVLASCNSAATSSQSETADSGKKSTSHDVPDWIIEGNIYEVNVRQYSPEGTFKAFEKSLPRLKEMGVQTLWFMPINPISKVDRKGALGSYYAVADYTSINPEFGTLQDWKELVTHAHDMGFKVVIDWVPNHTGGDHPWLKTHPDFYVKDSTGKALSPFDWTDVRQLNFENREMWDSMEAAMKFWVIQTDIDGFRCDHIEKFQAEFWKKCIKELRSLKKLFMLAEAEGGWLFTVGFDMDYGWRLFHTTVDIAAGKRTVLSIDTVLTNFDSTAPKNALQLYFTSNHDENSWNKADYRTMPGAIHAPFAVLTQTLPRGVPLIYSGQEEPVLDSISFFYKDTIQFKNFGREKFYHTLLSLRKSYVALSANASFRRINVGNDKAVYSFIREAHGKKILVITNLSSKEQSIKINDNGLYGNPYNLFMAHNETVNGHEWKIQPWGYVVYVY